MTGLFAHPERLWLLLALLPMAAWVAWGSRRRARDWRALGQSGRPVADGSWWWLASMAMVVVALGQPRWGRVLGPDAPSGHDVVLLVDTSRSMGAEDAVPDRLGVAIESGASLLKALGASAGDRASVVAFAGRGVVRCPLTSNLDAADRVLRSLRPGDVQPGGTDLGAALDAAIGAFDDEEHADGRTIVLLSDGEDHVGSWARAIDRLRAARIVVHSVAIGDPDRAHPVPSRADRGPIAETRRSDLAFEALARSTGGALVPIGLASIDLGALFRDRIEPTARRTRDDLRLPERVERFPAFLLLAVGIGLAGSWPGSGRRRGRRLAFSALAAACLSLGAGPPEGSAASLVARGLAAYDLGRFAEALDAFDRAIAVEPDAAIPRYDAAATLFQFGRHAQAIDRYEEARARGDAGLAIKIDYAMGNAHLALGDIPKALRSYDACLSTTLPGAAFDAVRLDAAANRAFAASRLEPPPEQHEPGGSDPAAPKKPRSPSKASKGEPGDSKSSPDRPGEGQGGSPPTTPGGRGAGGAGGSGPAPPPSSGSPEARLEAALKDVRDARSQRPPDPAPPASRGVDKDW